MAASHHTGLHVSTAASSIQVPFSEEGGPDPEVAERSVQAQGSLISRSCGRGSGWPGVKAPAPCGFVAWLSCSSELPPEPKSVQPYVWNSRLSI